MSEIHDVFSNREFPSTQERQPRATIIECIVSGVSWIPLIKRQLNCIPFHIIIYHPRLERYLGSFHFLAILRAVMNMAEQISAEYNVVFFGHMSRNGI